MNPSEPNPYQAPLTEGQPIKRRRLPRDVWAALVTLEGMLLGGFAVFLLLLLSGSLTPQLPRSNWSLVVSVGAVVFGIFVGGLAGSYIASRVQKNLKKK